VQPGCTNASLGALFPSKTNADIGGYIGGSLARAKAEYTTSMAGVCAPTHTRRTNDECQWRFFVCSKSSFSGICERFHRTLQEEFYSVAFRKKLYRSLDELQSDLDVWLGEYNEKREHSGKYCYGKTPWQTFLDSKHLAQAKMLDSLTATVSPDVEGQRAEQGLTRRRAAALSS
jgi:hypothetical protein